MIRGGIPRAKISAPLKPVTHCSPAVPMIFKTDIERSRGNRVDQAQAVSASVRRVVRLLPCSW